MKGMINVFGKEYSLSTLKAHGEGYNDIIEEATNEELKKHNIKFEASKDNPFSSEVTIKIMKKMSYEEDYYTIDFKSFAKNLWLIMKIYETRDKLYKKVN